MAADHLAGQFPDRFALLSEDLVGRLAESLPGHDLAMATSQGQPEPVFSLWPASLADKLRGALSSGVRKVEDFARAHRLATVEFPSDAFFNVNTPEDLQQAARRL